MFVFQPFRGAQEHSVTGGRNNANDTNNDNSNDHNNENDNDNDNNNDTVALRPRRRLHSHRGGITPAGSHTLDRQEGSAYKKYI